MRVIYNGVDMCVLETHMFDCVAVYDESGVDYLYTKVVISIRALINGQVEQVNGNAPGPFISYAMRGSQGSNALQLRTAPPPRTGTAPPPGDGLQQPTPRPTPAPVFRDVNSPALSHQVIRHRLSTPRGLLWIFSGPGSEGSPSKDPFPTGTEGGATGMKGNPMPLSPLNNYGGGVSTLSPDVNGNTAFDAAVILRSPAAGMDCDANNGPKPRVLSVISALGDANSFVVDWTCEAYINEGPTNGVNPTGALLSNRFAQTHTMDPDSYTTIHTEGQAIYRTDLVYSLLRNPDVDRNVLFMPIMQGFVRENIAVVGIPDVTGVHYSYDDVQVHKNFPSSVYCKAASISVRHRQTVTSNGNYLDTIASFASQASQLATNAHIRKSEAGKDAAAGLASAMKKAWAAAKPGKP